MEQAASSDNDPTIYEAASDDDLKRLERAARLDAFGMSMAKSRSEAIAARETSGIEDIWREDDEFYEGIDDLNRGDERSVTRNKPPVSGGGAGVDSTRRKRSRVFPNITGPFVDSAAAHISDILLPTEDRPWSFEPTPIPELQELADQYAHENPEDAEEATKKGFLARVKDRITAPNRNESEVRDENLVEQSSEMDPKQAFEQTEMAKSLAEATQTRVWDWQIECQYNAEVRKCIEDASRLGTGVLKGPIPRSERVIGWKAGEGGEAEPGHITLKSDTKPVSKRVDPWNFYPANGCGQNIQNGDASWERDYLTRRQLRKLKQDKNYLSDQIDHCLDEGPSRALAQPPETNSVDADNEGLKKYEIWYCYGMAERENLAAAGCDCNDIEDANIDTMVVLVNNRVIKASLPTTDYGGYPYDVFCWRKRANYWAGIGICRQVRTAQKIVVGATRSMMDNAGLAGGPMIVFKQGVVRPADGVAGIAPRKIFYIAKDDQTIDDATKAIGSVKVDIMVNEMVAIINFGLQIAENNSGFPMLMQGQMGKVPDRVGVVNVLDKNTNAIKRRLARNFSDDVMTPHLRRYYIYHLMYGPDNEKGDLNVNVKGYASLVERDIQNQELGQMYGIVTDMRFGLDPKKWAEEYLKSRHLNPADMKLDDQEWEKLLANWQQLMESSGQDPRVQVAKINAQARLQSTEMDGQIKGAIQISKQQHEAEQAELDRQIELVMAGVGKEIDALKSQNVSQDVIRKLKTDLAKKVMEIRSTEKLVGLEAPASALPTPPVEPIGQAPDGQSYQR